MIPSSTLGRKRQGKKLYCCASMLYLHHRLSSHPVHTNTQSHTCSGRGRGQSRGHQCLCKRESVGEAQGAVTESRDKDVGDALAQAAGLKALLGRGGGEGAGR